MKNEIDKKGLKEVYKQLDERSLAELIIMAPILQKVINDKIEWQIKNE